MLYALIAGLSVLAPAPKDQELPTGKPPEFAVVRLEKDDSLVLYHTVARQVRTITTEQVPVTMVDAQGAQVVKLVPVQKEAVKIVHERVPVVMQVKGLQGYDTNGKPIAGERLAELLKKEAIVLIYKDGQKPDPAYLRVVRDNTVILVFPSANAGAGNQVKPPRP